MASSSKYKRYTVNVPFELAEMIDKRIPEIPYQSESAYFLGLAIFDCWSRRPHRYTANLMSQPPRVRDEAFKRLAAEFNLNKKKSDDPGWFDQFVNRIVQEEIERARTKSEPRLPM